MPGTPRQISTLTTIPLLAVALTATSLTIDLPHAGATPVPATPPAATLVVGGTTFPTMSTGLMAHFTNTLSTVLINVAYPAQLAPFNGDLSLGASVDQGQTATLDLITTMVAGAGSLGLWGISQGAMVLDYVQRALAADPAAAPPADALTFVRVADPAQPGNGVLSYLPRSVLSTILGIPETARSAPESQYNTVEIVNEFDGFADFPDRPNPIAVLNAIVGLWYRHGQTALADLSTVPAHNITTTVNSLGATTTTYLVPAPVLPLTQALLDSGLPESAVTAIDAVLRPIVASGYGRNDTAAAPPAATALAASVTDSPTARGQQPAASDDSSTQPSTTPPPAPVARQPAGTATTPPTDPEATAGGSPTDRSTATPSPTAPDRTTPRSPHPAAADTTGTPRSAARSRPSPARPTSTEGSDTATGRSAPSRHG